MDLLPLHLSIAFFVLTVAGWAALCGHLYFKRRRSLEAGIAALRAELDAAVSEPMQQAA
ncbi:hypothetical protein [Flaviflagellibacter deserti]|uniref:CcmD family protein n=1 Tax=Flaviflagellibacter deserti TaxID=2267266 RepID=A0ABV9Z1K9_9HYPH